MFIEDPTPLARSIEVPNEVPQVSSHAEGILSSMAVNPAWIGRSVDETVRTLQALQSGKACPAGWRPGRKTL